MTEDARGELSEALRWLRERIGVSREQLAAASGVSAVHIKFVERGKRHPSEAVIQRLLPALRVTRHDLDGLLSLRPWASSTASGDPATLSTYAAGVPLVVPEGSEFDVPAALRGRAGAPGHPARVPSGASSVARARCLRRVCSRSATDTARPATDAARPATDAVGLATGTAGSFGAGDARCGTA